MLERPWMIFQAREARKLKAEGAAPLDPTKSPENGKEMDHSGAANRGCRYPVSIARTTRHITLADVSARSRAYRSEPVQHCHQPGTQKWAFPLSDGLNVHRRSDS